jgi:hypothetical protein
VLRQHTYDAILVGAALKNCGRSPSEQRGRIEKLRTLGDRAVSGHIHLDEHRAEESRCRTSVSYAGLRSAPRDDRRGPSRARRFAYGEEPRGDHADRARRAPCSASDDARPALRARERAPARDRRGTLAIVRARGAAGALDAAAVIGDHDRA